MQLVKLVVNHIRLQEAYIQKRAPAGRLLFVLINDLFS